MTARALKTNTAMKSESAFLVLLVGACLLEAAGYIAFPFLGLRMRDHFGMSMEAIGLALSCAIWARPLASFAGGWLSSRIQGKWLLCGACGFEGIGFWILAFADSPIFAVIGLLMGNIGFAIWAPNVFALASVAGPRSGEVSRFSLINGFVNFGAAFGCVVGGVVTSYNPRTVFVVAGLLYFGILPVLFPFVSRQVAPTLSEKQKSEVGRPKGKMSWKVFFSTGLLSLTFWATYGQFNGYIAMYANDWLKSAQTAGIAFAALAVLVAIFSAVLSRISALTERLPALSVFSLATLAVGWCVLTVLPSFFSISVFVLSLALCETALSVFLAESWSRTYSNFPGWAQGVNFSFRNAAMGAGGLLGGIFYHDATADGGLFPWLIVNFALVGIAVSSLLKVNSSPLLWKSSRRL